MEYMRGTRPMKATYEKPTLAKRDALSRITADNYCNVSRYGKCTL